ncbi:putative glycosidase [Flavihumibacter petaseus NBRC 106054]|uniref:Putative glycosidase n=1 Tax=Flavihumibacter petaseus NBRC 106054 TaxID=1220578 RepID=A0A0E9MYC7_9BACT|nr:putative glycosidase [Flavihumibacter petaseus NBRC 106054]
MAAVLAVASAKVSGQVAFDHSATVHPQAKGFVHAMGQKIVDGSGNDLLIRSIGLGGWMLQEGYMLRLRQEGQQYKIRERIEKLVGEEKAELFYQAWRDNHCTRTDVDSLKSWGFNAVRLPMHFALYTLPVEKEPVAGKQTWLEEGFRRTDSLLAWCRASGIYLILDLHAAPGGQGNDLNIADRNPDLPSLWQSAANREKTVALWKKLAERYRDETWIGAYDIINEPNWGFTDPERDKNGTQEPNNAPLRELLVNITNAIRSVDRNHMIIIEGNGWGNNYRGVFPPWDKNLAVSFHKYWNYNDLNAIRNMLETRSRYDVPVWVGETGENSNVWFRDAVKLLESQQIGWAWWPLKKLGTNNPLEVPAPTGYEQLLKHWQKNAPAPDDSWTILKALATNTRIDKNLLHYDVLDALFRQQHDPTARSFQVHAPQQFRLAADALKSSAPITIPAVAYDLGPSGVAYFDLDSADYHVSQTNSKGGNLGRQYRNDGVDVYRDSTSGYFYVGHTEVGEWLQYTFQVPAAGKYRISFLAAAPEPGTSFRLAINGKPAAEMFSVAATGSETSWKELPGEVLTLPAGEAKLRLTTVSGGYQLAAIMLQPVKKQ